MVDKNVFNIYLEQYVNIKKERVFLVDAVESNKNIDTVLNIWEDFMQKITLIKDRIFMSSEAVYFKILGDQLLIYTKEVCLGLTFLQRSWVYLIAVWVVKPQ